MARKLNGREIFLLGFVGLVGIAALIYMRGGSGIGGGQLSAEQDELQLGDAPVINLARLEAERVAYDPKGQDLFHYGKPPGSARRPPKVTPPPRKRQPRAAPPPPAAEPRKVEPTRPKPPPIRFEYIGFLGPNANKIAVFEDGDEILLARVGEVVQEEFRLVGFGYESVTMGYTDMKFKLNTTELRQSK